MTPGSSRDKCYKFLLDGYFVGFIHPMFLDWLLKYANVFVKISHPQHGDHCITVHQAMINVNDRSNAVAEVMQDLRTTSPFKALKGWRNEDYGVYVHNREKVLLKIERSASSLLGITRYGVHVNGFFSNRYNYSRKSDRIAAGGLTYGLDVMECARKECQEEASVPEHMLGKLTLVNQISYIFEDERGVCPQIEYCFDLELPPDFIPVSSDGEVDSFRLASISEVMCICVVLSLKKV
uniref:Nudix hydrolase 24, chloroplastic n=1 Tax=Schistosoma haematobium TaxID=6185 RepID=A0A095AHS3_SCHHA